jgi:hypothetical protein
MQPFIAPLSHSVKRASIFQPVFRLFTASEDQISSAQARKVQEQIEAVCASELGTTAMTWSFTLLCHDQLRERALLEAATADMIVISFRANGEVPAAVRHWLERLPSRPQSGQAALVALVGPDEQNWAGPHPQIPYLRELAERRRLDFISNQDGWEYMDFTKIAHRHSTMRIPAANDDLVSFETWDTGGINE